MSDASKPDADALRLLAQKIGESDAVLIGGGSGLSSACGYNHYHWTPWFKERLAPYIERYGFTSPFAGFYHLFSDYETQWAYYAAYMLAMYDAPTGEPYEQLGELVAGKPTFVITTNVDGQFQRVFDPQYVFAFQGDFGYTQCSQPCHDAIYDAHEAVAAMVEATSTDLRMPSELVPRCEECGRVMVPWVRDDTFLEGSAWEEQLERYQEFQKMWVRPGSDARLLLLEVGVGEMTPGVIKMPFWAMAQRLPNAFYASLNIEPAKAPLQLGDKALHVSADIKDTLDGLINLKEKSGGFRW